MCMFFQKSTNRNCIKPESGSALVIALIVLAILAALGIASLDVADINMFIAANDRDSKETFFHADSGTNIGHEYLEEAIFIGNATFYANDANDWQNSTAFNATDYPLTFYVNGQMATYIRAGTLDTRPLEGSSMVMAAGYEGSGKGSASAGSYTDFLVRAHREGRRNSRAEVDLGWRHIN